MIENEGVLGFDVVVCFRVFDDQFVGFVFVCFECFCQVGDLDEYDLVLSSGDV